MFYLGAVLNVIHLINLWNIVLRSDKTDRKLNSYQRMSTKTIAGQETKIKDALFEFVRNHTTNADLALIDDIVLSYVVSILEDVSSDPVFSVEGRYCTFFSVFI